MPDFFHQPLVRLALLALLASGGLVAWRLGVGESEQARRPPPPPALRVLLVGNSHSAPLPPLLRAMFEDAGANFLVEGETPGGQTLQGHAAGTATFERIRSGKWDVVVLQEQGQVPGWNERLRSRKMYPPAEALAQTIRDVGATVWWYSSYARPRGDPLNYPNDTFEAMQARMIEGYADAARRTQARIIPVGAAFAEAHRQRPDIALWNPDQIHASDAGYYLSAAVFAATLFGLSVEELSFNAALAPEDARFLRVVAARVAANARTSGSSSSPLFPRVVRKPILCLLPTVNERRNGCTCERCSFTWLSPPSAI
jgi:hypothetical protein